MAIVTRHIFPLPLRKRKRKKMARETTPQCEEISSLERWPKGCGCWGWFRTFQFKGLYSDSAHQSCLGVIETDSTHQLCLEFLETPDSTHQLCFTGGKRLGRLYCRCAPGREVFEALGSGPNFTCSRTS